MFWLRFSYAKTYLQYICAWWKMFVTLVMQSVIDGDHSGFLSNDQSCPGNPWKMSECVVEKKREEYFPQFLTFHNNMANNRG